MESNKIKNSKGKVFSPGTHGAGGLKLTSTLSVQCQAVCIIIRRSLARRSTDSTRVDPLLVARLAHFRLVCPGVFPVCHLRAAVRANRYVALWACFPPPHSSAQVSHRNLTTAHCSHLTHFSHEGPTASHCSQYSFGTVSQSQPCWERSSSSLELSTSDLGVVGANLCFLVGCWLLAVSIAFLQTSFYRRPADEFSRPAFPEQGTSQRGLAACLVSSTGK